MSKQCIAFIDATCPKCKNLLKTLQREKGSGWGVVDCDCGEWFDTSKYEAAGGKRVFQYW